MLQFRSRVSVLLLLLVVMSILPAFFLGEPNSHPYVAYGILGTTLIGLLWMLFSMRYIISENELLMKMGPFGTQRMDIRKIERIERSYNPLSSPSASLKRLYIKGNGQDALISPVDEAEFIRVLKSRNPNITVTIEDHDQWWQCWKWDI